MSDRISDEQLQLYLDQLESLRKRNPGEWMHEAPWRMALEEIRARRAQDLTSEDIASLDWCLGFIKMMRGDSDREPFNVHAERAIATLFKLLTRGNR